MTVTASDFMPAFTSFQSTQLADILATDVQDSRTWYIPSQFADPSDSVAYTEVVAGEVTAYFQGWIDAASAAYTVDNGRIHLIFPRGKWHLDQITLKSNVHYDFNETIWFRRSDANASNRSMLVVESRSSTLTVRDPIDLCWVSYQNGGEDPETWYGDGDNMRFSGKLKLDTNNKTTSFHVVRLSNVQDLVVDDGAIEINVTGVATQSWTIALSGRRIVWHRPVIRGGTTVFQDGFHINGGHDIRIIDGDVESGDDAFVVGDPVEGEFGPDEAMSDISVIGGSWRSLRARAIAIVADQDFTSSPLTEIRKVKRVQIVGAEGSGGIEKNQGVYVGDFSRPDKVYRFTIANPGAGYTNGNYICNVTGGTTTAKAYVRVAGGVITRAVLYKDPSLGWQTGAGYTGGESVDLSGIPAGAGGSVLNDQQLKTNDSVTDCKIQAQIQYGGNHLLDPYGCYITGCRRISLDLTLHLLGQDVTTPSHRPLVITGGQDIDIRLQQSGLPCQKAILVNQNGASQAGSVIDCITFYNGSFIGQVEAGGWISFTGPTIGGFKFQDCWWRDIQNANNCLYIVDRSGGINTVVKSLSVVGGGAFKLSGTPGAWLATPSGGGVGNQLVKLILDGVDLTDIPTRINGPTTFHAAVTEYIIRGVKGLPTRYSKAVTIVSGATTATLDISSNLAIGFPDTTSLGVGAIILTPTNQPTNAACTRFSVAMVSNTQATITCNSDPGASGWAFMANIDSSRKPLTQG